MKKHIIVLTSFVALTATASTSLIIDQSNTLITNQKQLTFVGARSGEGYFSIDGKKLIYQSEREEGNPFYQMFILDLASGKSSRISTGSGMTTCGWIHPNLKKAMWSSTHLDNQFKEKVKNEYDERAMPVKKRYAWNYDDQYDIFESDLVGKQLKRLTKELGYDAEGSYSPNGKLIAFASNRSGYKDKFTDAEKKIIKNDAAYAMEIYIMNSDGSKVKRLTTAAGYDGGPFFNSSGTKITWRRFTPDGYRAEIYTMNIDGSEQLKITTLNSLSWAPFFHPSSEYIIFTSSVFGYANFELFIVDEQGLGKPVRVTLQDGFDGLPTFSPDGKKISWTHKNQKGESQIYLADWDHEQALKLIKAGLPADKNPQFNFSPEITEQDTRQIIKYLASDELGGRATGSAEEKIYTEELAKQFKALGLKPGIGSSFIQTFEFTSSVTATEKNTVELQGRLVSKLKRSEDYQVLSYSKSGDFKAAPIVFAGYGIKAPNTDKLAAFDSYKDLDASGKWVLLLDHIPNFSDKEMKHHLLSYSRPQHKVTVAKNNKAAGVILVTDVGVKDLKFEGSLSESTLPVIKISTKTFSKMLEKSDSGYKSYSRLEKDFDSLKYTAGFNLNSQYISATIELNHHKSIGRNVIARLDPKIADKKAKAVIIGAHGDHLGRGEINGSSLARGDEKNKIHYGADDNASGVAGVLELAQYFSSATNKTKLRKPLYFAVWSGEEIGVLGSSYFTKAWKQEAKIEFKSSEFKDSFEASLNMDMIGRLRDKLQIQGVGSAKEWPSLSEEVGLVTAVPLLLAADPYLPTDALSFYLAEIPSISFFTGNHEEYHSPRDTEKLINYVGLTRVINVVRSFTEKLASVKMNIVKYIKVEGNPGSRLMGRSFRIYLGTIPDYAQEGVKGVKISGTAKNSPAEKAGLKAGDIITAFDKTNIENLYDYVYALQSAKPNQEITMNILRDGKKIELQLMPLLKE